MSTPYEGYRRKLAVHTAEGDAVTLIVTVQRGHRHGPVWLSFGATTRTTVALSGAEVGELTLERCTRPPAPVVVAPHRARLRPPRPPQR